MKPMLKRTEYDEAIKTMVDDMIAVLQEGRTVPEDDEEPSEYIDEEGKHFYKWNDDKERFYFKHHSAISRTRARNKASKYREINSYN